MYVLNYSQSMSSAPLRAGFRLVDIYYILYIIYYILYITNNENRNFSKHFQKLSY